MEIFHWLALWKWGNYFISLIIVEKARKKEKPERKTKPRMLTQFCVIQ